MTDIYGPKDLSQHLDAVRRILPLLLKFLPAAGLEIVADAVELNALSEALDAGMAATLGERLSSLTGEEYVGELTALSGAKRTASGKSISFIILDSRLTA